MRVINNEEKHKELHTLESYMIINDELVWNNWKILYLLIFLYKFKWFRESWNLILV